VGLESSCIPNEKRIKQSSGFGSFAGQKLRRISAKHCGKEDLDARLERLMKNARGSERISEVEGSTKGRVPGPECLASGRIPRSSAAVTLAFHAELNPPRHSISPFSVPNCSPPRFLTRLHFRTYGLADLELFGIVICQVLPTSRSPTNFVKDFFYAAAGARILC
jgi:hypothetical protein